MNEIDDLKAKARDFYWKCTAATTISSSSDAIAGLDRDAALPRECGPISVPGTEFRVMTDVPCARRQYCHRWAATRFCS